MSDYSCPGCGQKTHAMKGFLKKELKPITDSHVLNGVCRVCHDNATASVTQGVVPPPSSPYQLSPSADTNEPQAELIYPPPSLLEEPAPSAPPINVEGLCVLQLPETMIPEPDPPPKNENEPEPLTLAFVPNTNGFTSYIKHHKGKRLNDGYHWGTYVGPSGTDGKRHSYGIMQYDDGSRYEGEWANDWKHGDGKWYFTTGSVYAGTWRFGKREGTGYFYAFDGSVDLRKYKKDKCVGEGARWSADKSQVELLRGGIPTKNISQERGRRIANRLRLDVPY